MENQTPHEYFPTVSDPRLHKPQLGTASWEGFIDTKTIYPKTIIDGKEKSIRVNIVNTRVTVTCRCGSKVSFSLSNRARDIARILDSRDNKREKKEKVHSELRRLLGDDLEAMRAMDHLLQAWR